MKKCILFLPVFIISVFLSCVRFSASAITYQFPSRDDNAEITDSEIITACEAAGCDATNYMLVGFHASSAFTTNEHGNISQHIRGVVIIYSPDIDSAVENNGVYTFRRDQRFSYNNYSYISYENEDGSYNDYGSISWERPYWDGESGTTVIYDSNEGTLTVDGSAFYSGYHVELTDVKIHMGDILHDSSGLNVSVEFSPDFSGEVDRATYLDNGNVSYLDFFNFTVKNNGNTGIQYVMAIVEKGSSINFDSSGISDYGADRIIHDTNIKYVYISHEDCYMDYGGGIFTSATMNSTFHFVAAKDQAYRNHVKWDMIDLKENHEYDAVVYAVENEADKTSYVDSTSTTYKLYVADYVDYSAVSEVYRSTFTVKNPAKYDSTSSYHGAVANNDFTDYDDLTRTMYSYTDYSDGEKTLYGTYKYGQDVNNHGNLTWIDYGDYSKGSTSYASLVSEGSGVLRFFSTVLSYFPSPFLRIFTLGFSALIIISIIKRVF